MLQGRGIEGSSWIFELLGCRKQRRQELLERHAMVSHSCTELRTSDFVAPALYFWQDFLENPQVKPMRERTDAVCLSL